MKNLKEDILSHKKQIEEFISLIESTLFLGKSAHTVLSLKKYFLQVHKQLVEQLDTLNKSEEK